MINNKDPRPTSPHLQIYAWNISSLTSIMHRLTGVLLYLAIVSVSWYVVFYAYQINSGFALEASESCDCPVMQFFTYALYAFICAVIFAFCYHLCNGIRHLLWDMGKGYEVKTARFTGLLVVLLAVILTLITIGFIAYFKFL